MIYLLMALPLLLVPLIMRFILTRLIILHARRKLLPREMREMEAGWETGAAQAFVAAEATIQRRLKSLLPPVYDIRGDIEEILLAAQQKQQKNGESPEELRFSFSIRDAAEVGLLAFSDIYRQIEAHPLLKRLLKLRLRTLVWLNDFSRSYSRIFNRGPLAGLIRSRVPGLILRIILSPLIGLPILVFYLLRSMTAGLMSDGLFRYLYVLVLLKMTYYGIYLYGGENPLIAERLKALSRKDIVEAGKKLEKLLNPSEWEAISPSGEEAALRMNAFYRDGGFKTDLPLEEIGQQAQAGSEKQKKRGRKRRFLLREFNHLKGSTLLAVRRELGVKKEEYGIIEGLSRLFTLLGEVYLPGESTPMERLRTEDLLAAGYYTSILVLSKLYSAPGLRSTMGRISVDFAVKISSLSEDELVKQLFFGARSSIRMAGAASKIHRISRMLRGKYHPAGFAISFAPPLALAHIERNIKGGIYHTAGRLMLYIWEKNCLAEPPDIKAGYIRAFD